MANELSGYELSKIWFDWCFENPELINTNHTALYFFTIEHCNRLGWKEKFGLPSTMAKDAIGIKSYKTYINTLRDLVDWGFIKMIQTSKNQYSSNIVALVKITKAHTKALTKAMLKHLPKQVQSNDSIDKPINLLTNEPINLLSAVPTAAYWKKFISVWENWYIVNFKTKYEYQQKDFRSLKKMHGFFEKRAGEKKVEFTEQYLADAFIFFLEKAWKKDDWLKNNFSIPNLLSQFNQIVNGQSNSKIGSTVGQVAGKVAPTDGL